MNNAGRARNAAPRRGQPLAWLLVLALPAACTSPGGEAASRTARLPYLGERQVRPRPNQPPDTLVSRIPAFALRNQQGQPVTSQSLAGRVYVADFFFASCPSICPRVQREMQRVYRAFQGDSRVQLLSHTIDPAHDSRPVLQAYAERLGVADARQWQFVTAPRDTIFHLARAYATVATGDPAAPGRAVHDGTLALVDGHGYLRGLYDGLNPQETTRLLKDLPQLLTETSGEAPRRVAATALNPRTP